MVAQSGAGLDLPTLSHSQVVHAYYWNWLSSKSPAEPGRSLLLVALFCRIPLDAAEHSL